MNRTFYIQLIQFLYLYFGYNLINAKPFVGQNIRRVNPGEFDFVVGFAELAYGIPPEQRIFCSGAFITPFHVLTAEHCFINIGDVPFLLITGSNVLSQCRYFNPCWWLSYNQWAESEGVQLEYGNNDVAILKIIHSISSHTSPAPILVDAENTRMYGQNTTLVGWGDSNNGQTPQIMEATEVKILTKKQCDTLVTRIGGIKVRFHRRFLCSRSDSLSYLGNGDSGGPVLYAGFVIAISSAICPVNNVSPYDEKVNLHLDIYFYRNFICPMMNV